MSARVANAVEKRDHVRSWIPDFLTETRVRIFLQSLFVAIVGSGENCNTLLNISPDEITWEKTRGSDLARKCLLGASQWLQVARDNSASDSLFQSQVLGPARTPAQFMQTIRELAHPTTSLKGIAFAISAEYFDKDYGSTIVSLSVIIPTLGRTLSLRCRPELLGNIKNGYLELEGVQPMPFINRIHPVRLSAKREEGRLSLGSLDFLKISLFDLQAMTRSLAFENFSEIQSSAEGIRRMAVAGVVGGTLLFARPPFLTLQSCVDPNITLRVRISNEMITTLGRDPKQLEGFEGKPVRILCAAWYEPRKNIRSSMEGFVLQPAESVADVFDDEILGYVRVRRRVTRETLMAHFHSEPVGSTRLRLQKDLFEWIQETNKDDDLVAEFSKCENTIAESRASPFGMLLGDPDNVFGEDKLNTTTVGERISRSSSLFRTGNSIVRTRDLYGTLPQTRVELEKRIAEIDPDLSSPPIWWFRLMGLVSKEDAGFSITDEGMDAIQKADTVELARLLDQRVQEGQRVFCLLDLDGNARISPSIILSGLEKLAAEGKLVKTKDKLLWSTPAATVSELSPMEVQFELLTANVLSILQSVHHSLGTLKIVEVLRERGIVYSAFTTNIFLAWMKAQGLVKEPAVGMWYYPWKDRVSNNLRAFAPRYYTEDEIASLCSLPLGARGEIHQILVTLLKEGVVEEVLAGKWGAHLDEAGTQRRNQTIMEETLKPFVRANLRGRRFSYESLVERVEYIVLEHVKPPQRMRVDQRKLARKLVNDMIENREIIQEGNLLTVR